MNWQNNDVFIEENPKFQIASSMQPINTTPIHELEQNKLIQLRKFRDPSTNTQRQAYIALVTRFESCLISKNIDEMIKTLLTDDCEFFLFSSTGRPPVLYSSSPEGLHDLYKDIKVQEKRVGETYVDLEKGTVVQFSNFKIQYQDEESPIDEIVIEMFTIKNDRISKYRASFACMSPDLGYANPLQPSRNDKALAKIKQINYALADQPDLAKVASYFHENTQFKIWSWESQKCFTFGKHDLVEKFRNLEENLNIKCIVPYELYTDAKFVIGTYVYHLEGKSGKYINKKYIWMSTCIYAFDNDLNITKMNQQGEIHLEGDVEVPFGVSTKEKVVQKLIELHTSTASKANPVYDNIVKSSFCLYTFGPYSRPDVRFYEGLNSMNRLVTDTEEDCSTREWIKFKDIYIDIEDPSYDVAIVTLCSQSTKNLPEGEQNSQRLNTFHIIRSCFENGRIVKALIFKFDIPNVVQSPFDDPLFEAINIRKRV